MGCISNRGHPVRTMMRKSECAERDAGGKAKDRRHEDMYKLEEKVPWCLLRSGTSRPVNYKPFIVKMLMLEMSRRGASFYMRCEMRPGGWELPPEHRWRSSQSSAVETQAPWIPPAARTGQVRPLGLLRGGPLGLQHRGPARARKLKSTAPVVERPPVEKNNTSAQVNNSYEMPLATWVGHSHACPPS